MILRLARDVEQAGDHIAGTLRDVGVAIGLSKIGLLVLSN